MTHFEVQEAFLHLTLLRYESLVIHFGRSTKLCGCVIMLSTTSQLNAKDTNVYIPMPLKVKYRERAYVAQAVNVNGELSEKVDDFGGTIRKSKEKDKRRQNY